MNRNALLAARQSYLCLMGHTGELTLTLTLTLSDEAYRRAIEVSPTSRGKDSTTAIKLKRR